MRYALGTWIQQLTGSGFPWGTLAVNVTGSLLLGFIYAFLEGTAVAPEWRLFAGIGFCGGYTTFSTFSYESIRLLQDGEWKGATAYVLASVALSLIGLFVGLRVATVLRSA